MSKKRKGTNTGIPGMSFSWRRATSVTQAKRDFAKLTGIPTTKSGRQRKIGSMMTGGGCLMPVLVVLVTVLSVIMLLV